ncbi:hypothetical protein H8E88_14775 [candidate division KSB1 bacterium]|nr:hypothetical protein [candidate division KSB1 bacterium]MBL7095509.1 hypothetical protein [candidate division KSB1 bacterium]
MNAKENEKISNALSLLKFLIPAEEDIKEIRYKEARSFFQEFKIEKNMKSICYSNKGN